MTKNGKVPTMADVARETGVSSMTVSRAFKADAKVNAKTREAIIKAADRLGYVFDSTAAGLSSRKTGFIAALIPSINNANFADTVRGLTDGLKNSRLQVLLGYTNYDTQEEERLVRQLLMRRPEAIMLTGGVHTEKCRHMLKKTGIPVIETWDMPDHPIGDVVGFSNADAMVMTVQHLIAEGYQKIAFFGGDTDRDSRGLDRRRGFIHEMEKHAFDPSRLIELGSPPISMREGAKALSQLITKWPDTEAIICVSDLAAFGALSECQRRGIDVPGQLAICGFGAYEISDMSVPSITTIDPQCYQIGHISAQKILHALGMSTTDEANHFPAIYPKLVPRGSTVRTR